jgi:hypothetical protein
MVILLLIGFPAEAAAAPNPHNITKCLLCHRETPRFGIDTRETVTFRGGRTSDDPVLCSFCHRAGENLHPLLVEPGPEMLGTEKPSLLPLGESGELKGKVVCTTCHFYHAAETDYALLRGFPGSQKPAYFSSWQDLCRDCHGDGLEKRSPHAGDERACVFCHQVRPAKGEKPSVAPRGAGLCNFCHGAVQNKHFLRANPYREPVECSTCHDPHLGPESLARLKPGYFDAARNIVTIDPHYRKALCFACHLEGDNYPLRSADPVELCNRCHGSGEITGNPHPLGRVADSFSPPADWPLKEGTLTCLTCHLAGHPEDQGRVMLLRGGPYPDSSAFCDNCHDRSALKGRNPHRGINQGKGCSFCHSKRPVPGLDTIDTAGLIANPNTLCLRCHAPDPHPGYSRHTVTLEVKQAAAISKEVPLYRGREITCATCHNPHIEEVGNYKLRGGISGTMICGICHQS